MWRRLKHLLEVLQSRRILLISPQPWDHLLISKHHYAEELAAENYVVFLEPPQSAGIPMFTLRPHPSLDRLRIASWRPFTPKMLRFHAYTAYRAIMRRNAAWLARKLGGIDIVWCFDFNVFPELDSFGTQIKIFHPVDPLSSDRQIAIGDTADLIISVSERILSNFVGTQAEARTLLVNHGLSSPFEKLARQPVQERRPGPVRCGFFGNLDRSFINFDLLRVIIDAHPDVEFHFWGSFHPNGHFSLMLAPLANVHVHGAIEKAALAREVADMDLFTLTYSDHTIESDRSNAHKLLEYMSTGKTIVTTRMDCYEDDPDLVRMSRAADDSDFEALFSQTIFSILQLNQRCLMEKRKAYCRQFTYRNNVQRIDAELTPRFKPTEKNGTNI